MAWRSLRRRSCASITTRISVSSAELGGSITFMVRLERGKVDPNAQNSCFQIDELYEMSNDIVLFMIGGREKAPAAFCRKALTSVDKFEMWGDGLQTRSFTFIDECVEGVLR